MHNSEFPHNSTNKRNEAIVNRKKSMLWKLRSGKPKKLGEIDVFGSIDSQSLAELVNEKKIEVVEGSYPITICNEVYQIGGLYVQLKK